MSNMSVTYADLIDAAARLRLGKEDMNSKLLELGALIDSLVQAGFVTDHASKAYDEQFNTFQAGAKVAIDALDGLATFLDQTASTLDQTDTQLANSIKA